MTTAGIRDFFEVSAELTGIALRNSAPTLAGWVRLGRSTSAALHAWLADIGFDWFDLAAMGAFAANSIGQLD